MSNKNARRIQSFLVHDGLQEIVGEEDRRFRYVLLLAMAGVLYVVVDLILRSQLHEARRIVFVVLAGIAALVLGAKIRPWHRQIVINRNGPECRVEWRFLFFLPVSSRSYAFEGRVLDVGTITYEEMVAEGKSGETPWGCLLFFIPFPFNLLAGAFSKPPEQGKVTAIKRRAAVLILRDPDEMVGKPIVPLANLRVADPLLRAVGELLPESVILPPPETASEE